MPEVLLSRLRCKTVDYTALPVFRQSQALAFRAASCVLTRL